jgi:hypothetical protein
VKAAASELSKIQDMRDRRLVAGLVGKEKIISL